MRKVCDKNRTTIYKLSEDRFFRSETYLQSGLKNNAMPVTIMASLAEYMGVSLKEYEIPVLPVQKEARGEAGQKCETPAVANEKWRCEIRVDEEFGTTMARIIKDGETVCVGRSYLYGEDDLGIVQSISYAVHMCYKLVQQGQIENLQTPKDKATERESSGSVNLNKLVRFKDWVRKYEKDASTFGEFARYVGANYDAFPAKGEKQMNAYINLNKGNMHQTAFKTLFKQYKSWCVAN